MGSGSGGFRVGEREDAVALDNSDPLRGFRDRFVIDDLVYLDGNSLGRLPKATVERVADVVSVQWGERVVRGWDEGWLDLPLTVGDRLGSAALGAAPGQVAIGDSTTVCFYKLVSAALDLRPERRQIVADVDNFPTDRYVLEGLARVRGLELVWLRFDPAAGPTVDRRRGRGRPRHGARHLLARLLPLGVRGADGRDQRGCGGGGRVDVVGPQSQRWVRARWRSTPTGPIWRSGARTSI